MTLGGAIHLYWGLLQCHCKALRTHPGGDGGTCENLGSFRSSCANKRALSWCIRHSRPRTEPTPHKWGDGQRSQPAAPGLPPANDESQLNLTDCAAPPNAASRRNVYSARVRKPLASKRGLLVGHPYQDAGPTQELGLPLQTGAAEPRLPRDPHPAGRSRRHTPQRASREIRDHLRPDKHFDENSRCQTVLCPRLEAPTAGGSPIFCGHSPMW